MKSIGSLASLFGVGTLAVALSSCSPASSAAVPGAASALSASRSTAAIAASPQAGPPDGLLFVAAGRSNVVQIYKKNLPNALVGQITAGLHGPNGMVVDPAGNLFVANTDVPVVTEYPPGVTTPSVIYRKGLTNPLNVTLGADGTLYVVNYYAIGHGSAIIEYPPHSLNPSFTIRFPGGFEGLALDRKNNLYASYNGGPGGRVLKFAPGSKQATDLGISIGFAGGIAFDGNGNLAVCDQTGSTIGIYPPGAIHPSKVIANGAASPYHIAFGKDFKRLYVADNVGKAVLIYSYPDAAIIGRIQRATTAYGVAVNPSAPVVARL